MLIKLFSSILSPLYSKELTDVDISIFTCIGKSLLQGKILYKDVFDHKTPYIYFINAFFNIFDYRHIGLYILEVILLYIILLFSYKICKLFITNEYKVIVIVGILSLLLNNHNITFLYSRTEMYAIAFLLPCIYQYLKLYIADKNVNYIIIGLLCGITFMTNIKAIILIIPFILCDFINHNDVLTKIYKLIFGFIISVVPYIIYMIVTDSFKDFYEAVVNTNFIYATKTFNTQNLNSSFISIFNYDIKTYLPILIFMIFILASIILLVYCKVNKFVKISVISSFALACMYTFIIGRLHIYYLVIFIPFSLSLFINLIKHTAFNFNRKITAILLLIFLLISFLYNYPVIKNKNEYDNKLSYNINYAFTKHFGKSFDIKNYKLLSLGFFPEAYIYTDADINYKYFFIPKLSYNAYSKPYIEQYNYLNNKDPDIVIYTRTEVTNEYPPDLIDKMNDILMSSYDMICEIPIAGVDNSYYLFVKK